VNELIQIHILPTYFARVTYLSDLNKIRSDVQEMKDAADIVIWTFK